MQRISGPLTGWFSQNRREMEWRASASPYYVWVSEIMLQQTRVETVRPYFHRFVQALPDVGALAACDEEKLLKLWEGLGYYSRVRNMQRASRIVMEQYDGILPADAADLKALPGIGSYTAGAIASIAYGRPEPAVDGNVLRVLSRVYGSYACVDDPKVKAGYEDLIRRELTSETAPDPGIFNQALMELGALVCLPLASAMCGGCPIRSLCRAYAEHAVEDLPVRKAKQPRRVEEKTVLVVRDGERTILHKRPDTGLLAGMWELPNLEGYLSVAQALEAARRIGIIPLKITPLPDRKHIFTHVEWHMRGYLIQSGETEALADGYAEVDPEETKHSYSIPSAFAGYTRYLQIVQGQKRFGEEFRDP